MYQTCIEKTQHIPTFLQLTFMFNHCSTIQHPQTQCLTKTTNKRTFSHYLFELKCIHKAYIYAYIQFTSSRSISPNMATSLQLKAIGPWVMHVLCSGLDKLLLHSTIPTSTQRPTVIAVNGVVVVVVASAVVEVAEYVVVPFVCRRCGPFGLSRRKLYIVYKCLCQLARFYIVSREGSNHTFCKLNSHGNEYASKTFMYKYVYLFIYIYVHDYLINIHDIVW